MGTPLCSTVCNCATGMRASFLLMALGCVCAIVCHLHTASGLSIALVGTSSSPALALFALRHASLASGGSTEYLSHSLSYIEYSNRDAVFNLALSLGQENITSRSSVLALDPELVVGGVLDVAMEYSERDVCPERYLSEKNLVCVPLAVSGLVPIVNLDGVVFGDGDLVLTREIILDAYPTGFVRCKICDDSHKLPTVINRRTLNPYHTREYHQRGPYGASLESAGRILFIDIVYVTIDTSSHEKVTKTHAGTQSKTWVQAKNRRMRSFSDASKFQL